ncbi:hypothetical protein [Rahnella inusitata]|uniref:hypothetical protein n=1 Tax=Rahnella inusitata TaxID=58169 RepID=UPI001FD2F492|nr:hypothetical protein [Rahnella inusitata]
MLNREKVEATILALASKEGIVLNGQDKLVMRTSLSNVLAAKERHRQRMGTSEFQWKKPAPPKR